MVEEVMCCMHFFLRTLGDNVDVQVVAGLDQWLYQLGISCPSL